MAENHPNILVIGATSSLAQAMCRTLAAKGYGLILAGRDERELELLSCDIKTRFDTPCHYMLADITAQHFSPMHFIEQAGPFDHAVIAVGDMGHDDPRDITNIAYVTHVNYTVPAQIAAVVAEHMAGRQKGSLVIISSIAGDRGRQSNYPYGSAKGALSTFTSGLRNRYNKLGVHVMTVKPGFTDTPMTWPLKSPLIASREYVAKKIVDAMEKKKDVLYVPFFWRYIMLIITHIPERIFKKLNL